MNGKENVNSRCHVRKSINGVSYLTYLKSGERERERGALIFLFFQRIIACYIEIQYLLLVHQVNYKKKYTTNILLVFNIPLIDYTNNQLYNRAKFHKIKIFIDKFILLNNVHYTCLMKWIFLWGGRERAIKIFL